MTARHVKRRGKARLRNRPRRRLLVTGLKGGVGKTMTAANLAAERARLGRRVLLLDIDPVGGSTFLVTGERAASFEHTVATVLVELSRGADELELFERVVIDTSAPTAPMRDDYSRQAWQGIWLVPCNAEAAWLTFPGSDRLDDLDRWVTTVIEHYGIDDVVLDAGASANPLTVAGMRAAREALAVAEAAALSMHAINALFSDLRKVMDQRPGLFRLAGVLINKVGGRRSEAASRVDSYRDQLGDLLCDTVMPDYWLVPESEGAGLPIREMRGQLAGHLADRYPDVWDHIDKGER